MNELELEIEKKEQTVTDIINEIISICPEKERFRGRYYSVPKHKLKQYLLKIKLNKYSKPL